LLSSVAGMIADSGTDTFVDYVLPTSVTITAGDRFFVGVEVNTLGTEVENSAVGWDLNSNAGASWIASDPVNPIDLNDLTSGQFLVPLNTLALANYLIRAEATFIDDPIPQPSTPFFLLTAGVSALVFARRRG
jgi:hypothetical protein